MKVTFEINRAKDGYEFVGDGTKIFFKSMEAASRHATEMVVRKCYQKMTDIPQSKIDVFTKITLVGSEFMDEELCAHHYLDKEKE